MTPATQITSKTKTRRLPDTAPNMTPMKWTEFSTATDVEVNCESRCERRQASETIHDLAQDSKTLCDVLIERAMGDDAWTRAKQPTSQGGLGIRSGVSQADVAFAVTVRKTETQVEMTRGGRNTQETAGAELATMDGVTMKDDGEVRLANLDERDVLQVRFRDDIIAVMREVGSTQSMSRILATAALLSNCGAGVSTTWTEPAPTETPKCQWRDVRVRADERRTRRPHLVMSTEPVEKENTQKGARQTGPTAAENGCGGGLGRGSPQLATTLTRTRLRNCKQWSPHQAVTTRRSTAIMTVHDAASEPGYAASVGEIEHLMNTEIRWRSGPKRRNRSAKSLEGDWGHRRWPC